ncbi:PilZ domain-containing protein [Aestuariibacter sp. AA17]|uniref:PilZ domain-containing protein n=1 Tax=Fluctibacter corallii TaxID=2984329 RepID=A0ABT3A3N3_9ALTE|nr:PilZ domain-containing protein [Aestuariibacter sp. AA17]MCV2883235.1 PilZ domain-containing protein [Aestuariibacter sp. AA17]
MSQDLEEYQHIIEQLKPMISEPEFNQALNQQAAGLSKSKRFLIKMELKRLARPCIRVIDLRGQVEGEIREFEYAGIRHFLDDAAIEIFERQVRSFGDYTIGVYESVVNVNSPSRTLYNKLPSAIPDSIVENIKDSTPYNAPNIAFGDFAQRHEERMNYAVSIEVFTELNKGIPANTVDVSVSGLKIKVNQKEQFKLGDKLLIQFRGLEGEYSFDRRQSVPYIVMSIEHKNKEQRLSLRRVSDIPVPEFDHFISRFIHGNKRRYKVNMDNTLEAIQYKMYEQYFMPNFSGLPVFIECIDDEYSPRFAMANDCNRDILQYWSDEQQEMRLGYAFSHARIQRILNRPRTQWSTFLYVFNHLKDDKVYFYSATKEELLANPIMMTLFLGYGARKASWRIFNIQFSEMSMEQAHIPLSIPDSVSPAVKRQNTPPPPRLLAKLKHLTHFAVITDITDEHSHSGYELLPIRKEQIGALKVFGHPKNRPPKEISAFRFKYFNQRKETRYQLRTKIEIFVDDILLDGVSEDVSVKGLRIELQSFYHLPENSEVKVSFPQLQKVTSKYALKDLVYVVKGISPERNILHLQAVNDLVNNTAQRFFDELIRKNKSRLVAYKEEEDIPGIGTALRNVYTQNLVHCAFFIRKDGINFIPDALAMQQKSPRLQSLLNFDAEPGYSNLSFLYHVGLDSQDFISTTLKRIKPHQRPVARDLFIAFNPSKSVREGAIKCRFAEQFNSHKERRAFINSALKNGQFIGIRVYLTRTGRPDTEFLQSEINYIGVYAVHKAKVIEEQLWNIVGMGELIDISDDIMQRFQFSEEEIKHNAEPIQHEIKTTKIEQLLRA